MERLPMVLVLLAKNKHATIEVVLLGKGRGAKIEYWAS